MIVAIASYSGPFFLRGGGGGERNRAWYTLLMHVPDFTGRVVIPSICVTAWASK